MKHTVELKNELYNLFKADDELLKILNVQDRNNKADITRKIKRYLEADDVIDDTLNAFFYYTFIQSVGSTKNYKVNANVLEFRLYARNQATIDKMYLQIKKILQANYEDMRVVAEGSFQTSTVNLVGYLIRFRPLTWS